MKLEVRNMKKNGILILFIGEREIRNISDKYPDAGIAAVTDIDWNAHLSPWFAPKVFKKGEDFAGHAQELIAFLDKELEPVLRAFEPNRTIVIGYSLAGLFALYLVQNRPWFTDCASVSGSLWYPDWIAYLRNHPLHAERVYFSVGRREKESRNQLMSRVEICTQEAQQITAEYAETVFELNEGNHFENPEERMEKALDWLLKDSKGDAA